MKKSARIIAAPTEEPIKPKRADDPEDACSTAAYKLNVAITLVQEHTQRIQYTDRPNPDDDAGYGLDVAADLLIELRDYLRAAADGSRPRTVKGGA